MGVFASRAVSAPAALCLVLAACSFNPGRLAPRDGDVADDARLDTGDSGAPVDGGPLDTAMGDAMLDAALNLACPLTYGLTNGAEPGSKYRLVTASDDWAAAEADCEDDGGGGFLPAHLVVLDDANERAWVFDQGTTDKWIGASDINTENTLQAVTDQASPYFGNPSSMDGSKDCMFTNQNETVMESCTAGFQYICECDGLAANPNNF